MEAVDMEDISSSEDNVILNCCENHCFKDVSDIHLVNIYKKRYDKIIDILLQEDLICKRTYAKK